MQKRSVLALGAIMLAIASVVAVAQAPGRVAFLSSYTWTSDLPEFGGYSGLELADDGRSFIAVSDGGFLVTGDLSRNAASGDITGVEHVLHYPLRGPDGVEMQGIWDDGEGLAVAPSGAIYVSFEGEHRVWRYDAPGGNAVEIPQHADFAGMQNNSSLEVLAMDTAGSLFTMPERSGVLTLPFPVYRFRDGKWDQPLAIARISPFLPVGGDFGPDGKFYLLERHLSGIFGFQTRVRRFDLKDPQNGEIILETSTGKHDNLEGISVWRDAAGDIRMTMISDDNFRSFQRTEFVEYRITE